VAKAKDVGAGLVDVKSFWVEPAEEVASRIRDALKHVSPEKLTVLPDCGFFQLPRWLAYQKLQRLAEGVRIVRRELTGSDS
jgi:5-methyltetrahydropteroyltriglutamate--homocysteine methyltransferase